MSYSVGDLILLTAKFTDPSTGNPVTPTAVTCEVRDPVGNTSSPSVSTPSSGTYTAEIDVELAGLWYYRFAGTGANQAAEEGRFQVEMSGF